MTFKIKQFDDLSQAKREFADDCLVHISNYDSNATYSIGTVIVSGVAAILTMPTKTSGILTTLSVGSFCAGMYNITKARDMRKLRWDARRSTDFVDLGLFTLKQEGIINRWF